MSFKVKLASASFEPVLQLTSLLAVSRPQAVHLCDIRHLGQKPHTELQKSVCDSDNKNQFKTSRIIQNILSSKEKYKKDLNNMNIEKYFMP